MRTIRSLVVTAVLAGGVVLLPAPASAAIDCGAGADALSEKGAPADEVGQWYVDCLGINELLGD